MKKEALWRTRAFTMLVSVAFGVCSQVSVRITFILIWNCPLDQNTPVLLHFISSSYFALNKLGRGRRNSENNGFANVRDIKRARGLSPQSLTCALQRTDLLNPDRLGRKYPSIFKDSLAFHHARIQVLPKTWEFGILAHALSCVVLSSDQCFFFSRNIG